MVTINDSDYYLLFSYNYFLKGYVLIDSNFNLNGLEEKLQPYYEKRV